MVTTPEARLATRTESRTRRPGSPHKQGSGGWEAPARSGRVADNLRPFGVTRAGVVYGEPRSASVCGCQDRLPLMKQIALLLTCVSVTLGMAAAGPEQDPPAFR